MFVYIFHFKSSFRGGVLEPEGIVEIKFRKKDLIKTMHRLDPEIDYLTNKMKEINQTQPEFERKNSMSQQVERKKSPEIIELENKITSRENYLLPMYHQVAVHFADLHDTAERMHEKGTINVRDLIVNVHKLFVKKGIR